jgi:hypothetical protein
LWPRRLRDYLSGIRVWRLKATLRRAEAEQFHAALFGGLPPGDGLVCAAGKLRCGAWQWALANRSGDGSLPSGRDIGRQHGRHDRWGRLVMRSGLAGELDQQT